MIVTEEGADDNGALVVMERYESPGRDRSGYQREDEMENALIASLASEGYGTPDIHDEAALKANLRDELERLNGIEFTDSEWARFYGEVVANKNDGAAEKTQKIQRDRVFALTRDDGTKRNVYLIDDGDVMKNRLQVIHQYRAQGGASRYDVTILVNGLPLVQIELKRRGVRIREAFNQIARYSRTSYDGDDGLFDYIQIFVISNGTETKYYSNTTRTRAAKEASSASAQGGREGRPAGSSSFEFTSYWADSSNRNIGDIEDFARTFLSPRTLLSVLTRYCVLDTTGALLVMRPYQIAAAERILRRIGDAHEKRLCGSRGAGGYIWHSTGSGKTLTSFKTAQLAVRLPYIEKVLFVVDRKDLDYQTIKEYERFEKGCVSPNTSTAVLQRQLANPSVRLIVTTIQKLSQFIKNAEGRGRGKQDEGAVQDASALFDKEVVFIFDECHRSQFGEFHKAITRAFKKYYIFGFTGTPIFSENAFGSAKLKTTDDVFGARLHTYNIASAVRDGAVLPFRVGYVSTMRKKDDIKDEDVYDIDRPGALDSSKRIELVARYILEHFAQETRRTARDTAYETSVIADVASAVRKKDGAGTRRRVTVRGFNSILATSSIETAKNYYNAFKRLQKDSAQHLRVAIIYSASSREDDGDEARANGFLDDENSDGTEGLSASDKAFLVRAVEDYNAMFGTSYGVEGESFQNYYKDVSLRTKNREVDILIVVNMFLTGFDAPTLNTIWVDKNLWMHGLLQAFSRTNRILNSVKVFGNVVCFRNLEDAVKQSLAIFGDKDAHGSILMRTFKEYYEGYTDDDGKREKGYALRARELKSAFPLGGDWCSLSRDEKKDFVMRFGAILRLRNVLEVFDEFSEAEKTAPCLSGGELQDYTSHYLDIRDEFTRGGGNKVGIEDDIVFELELIKHVEVTFDYILDLVKALHASHGEDRKLRVALDRAIGGSPDLRSKKALIERFIASLTPDKNVLDMNAEWGGFVKKDMEDELERIIAEQRLKHDETISFMDKALRNGVLQTTGVEFARLLPKISPFSAQRGDFREDAADALEEFFDTYCDVTPPGALPGDVA